MGVGLGEVESRNFDGVDFFDGTLGLVVEVADGVDLIAEEFDADGAGGGGGPAVEDAAAAGGFALGVDFDAELISVLVEPLGELVGGEGVVEGEGAKVLLGVAGEGKGGGEGLWGGDDEEGFVGGEAGEELEVLADDGGVLAFGLEEQKGLLRVFEGEEGFVELVHFVGGGGNPEKGGGVAHEVEGEKGLDADGGVGDAEMGGEGTGEGEGLEGGGLVAGGGCGHGVEGSG